MRSNGEILEQNKMIKTNITSGREARQKLLSGVNKMANAVGSTLGPMGQNVAIERTTYNGDTYERIVLHDGVSVARSIDLTDNDENMGAQLLKEASQKQVDQVGDGTTVTMILAQALVQESMQLIESGVQPMSLRRGLEDGSKRLLKKLEELATPIKDKKDLEFISTISAEDPELGKLVSDTVNKLGKDGVVTVEASKSATTEVEHQEGMQLDRGWLNEYFITNPQRMEAKMEDAYILVTDKDITTLSEMGKFFESFVPQSKKLVIISPNIGGEALPLLIQNKLQGKLFPLCIQAPSFGEDQKNILQDIAVMTGATFFSNDAGYKFEQLTPAHLGFVQSITSTKDSTIIVSSAGNKDLLSERIQSITKAIQTESSEFNQERLKARLGKLTNGVAVIRVGGHTEIEMKERRERTLDAVAACRAALDKGIVPGGEIVYLTARKILDTSVLTDKILYDALYKPFQRLILNAGISEVDAALLLKDQGTAYGIDVTTGKLVDMQKTGIVDPVLVSINALQNAVSVAIQTISTGYIITPEVMTHDEKE